MITSTKRACELARAGQARFMGYVAVPAYALLNRLSRRRVVDDGVPVVVCLTTFGRRTRAVQYAIESIGRGSVRPARLVLWLDDPGIVERPPPPLARLVNRGLELRLTRDFGSHKKYYPYVTSHERHVLPMVTADDDVAYPRWWLQRLLTAHHTDPDAVWCYRAREVVVDLQGRLRPYATWPSRAGTAPSHRVLPTGTSGILYPPGLLDAFREAGDGFLDRAPQADDLWLHHVALERGVPARLVLERSRHFPLLPHDQSRSLTVTNQRGGNDAVLRHLYGDADLARLRD